jgi:citrate synthase
METTANGGAPATVIARGLAGVVVTQTRLSHVDGEHGELLIGGYRIDDLAPRAAFEDVLHLLLHDRVPTAAEAAALRDELAARRALPRATLAILEAAALHATPAMDALRMAAATLSLDDPDLRDESRAATLRRALACVARFPTIVATYSRLRHRAAPVAPHRHLGHVANYLYMLSGTVPDAVAVRALETYMNTVIDHGMNASTFAARVIVSTRSDLYSALVGAVGALKGPLHGGAPGPALDMVFEIRGRAATTGRSLADEAERCVRDKVAAGERIMGFGHRVYKVRDPRAEILRTAAAAVFARAGDTRLYDDACTVEDVVLRVLHEVKPGRRLETNMEYYTALLLHGIGLDPDLFTPTFAVARVGGWAAHVIEQIDEDHLIRPSVAYAGARDRRWGDPPPPAAVPDTAYGGVRPPASIGT